MIPGVTGFESISTTVFFGLSNINIPSGGVCARDISVARSSDAPGEF